MFDTQQYYKYINTLENTNKIAYIIIIIIGIIIGIATGGITLLITIPISILIANVYTFKTKIQIEKMKWEIEIYSNIKDIKNKNGI